MFTNPNVNPVFIITVSNFVTPIKDWLSDVLNSGWMNMYIGDQISEISMKYSSASEENLDVYQLIAVSTKFQETMGKIPIGLGSISILRVDRNRVQVAGWSSNTRFETFFELLFEGIKRNYRPDVPKLGRLEEPLFTPKYVRNIS